MNYTLDDYFADLFKKIAQEEYTGLKVGDKVRVKDDADLVSIYLRRTDFKSPYGEIKEIDTDGDLIVYFEDIGDHWSFRSHMVEKIVEEVPAQTPKQVFFSPTQVRSAAEFLHNTNSYLDYSIDEFEKIIVDYIKRETLSDSTYVGTAGFYIVFSNIGENIVEAQVLVDPNVSGDGEFVLAELKDGKLVVEY